MMNQTSIKSLTTPHLQLYCETNACDQPGRWRFVLQAKNNDNSCGNETPCVKPLEASGTEDDLRGERLELLCVVRGLEALEQPSNVTLITSSKYVSEGIRFGLDEWRESDWRWEAFGEMVPVKNGDLWQRVDTALRFHSLQCCMWRFDAAHTPITEAVIQKTAINNEKTQNRLWQVARAIQQAVWLYRRLHDRTIHQAAMALDRVARGATELRHAVRIIW